MFYSRNFPDAFSGVGACLILALISRVVLIKLFSIKISKYYKMHLKILLSNLTMYSSLVITSGILASENLNFALF